MSNKPRIPKGTRDFSPRDIAKRNFIFDIIKTNFESFGFEPIETPSFENSETLFGQYGDEGDRLIFKILDSGDFLNKVSEVDYAGKDASKLAKHISKKALRYDLTVPFARYVVQHQNNIIFPFKRYQMQLVWRADRPQKGRFREFYQCDADAIGSTSLCQEIEFIQLYDAVFNDLKFDQVVLKINNRKLLSGLVQLIGAEDQLIDFTIALDKLDKIGEEKVKEEWLSHGISKSSIKKLQPLFDLKGTNESKLDKILKLLKDSNIANEGINELKHIINATDFLGLNTLKLDFDITLARGLNYYTGSIFEVGLPNFNIGSVGGGGRYDNLTKNFGLANMSGIGISFGFDRIYLAMEYFDLFPETLNKTMNVLFINFGKEESLFCLKAVKTLRAHGFVAELYPDTVKLKKQLQYANNKQVEFVVLVGDKELKSKTFTLRNMMTGRQSNLSLNELITQLDINKKTP